MEIRDAAAMLKNAHLDASKKTVWADLGCGSGTFPGKLRGIAAPIPGCRLWHGYAIE